MGGGRGTDAVVLVGRKTLSQSNAHGQAPAVMITPVSFSKRVGHGPRGCLLLSVLDQTNAQIEW